MKQEFVKKLITVEQEISTERGAFEFFGIFLREDAPDKWDLVVAAPWLEEEKNQALRYLSDKVGKILDPDELLVLSRIVVMDHGTPALEAILRVVRVEHKSAEFQNCDFFGLAIKHAFIITSKRLGEPSAEKAG